jgi:hypothetical protein
VRRSTDPHDLARGPRQSASSVPDTLTPVMTPFLGAWCHAQVRVTIEEFVRNDTLTSFRIGRCAREAHTPIVDLRWDVEALLRVSDRAGCQGVILHVMRRCFADLGMTPCRFSRVSGCHAGCHPPVIRAASLGASSPAMLFDGPESRFAARERLTAALRGPATPNATSEAPAGAPAVARAVVRFTAPTVAREDWCA